ncbi:MAG: hypothetical protein IPM39_05040 [Chloroflexi bacterium]|nr:hypothetical protein [Chloroflexota bacterium]
MAQPHKPPHVARHDAHAASPDFWYTHQFHNRQTAVKLACQSFKEVIDDGNYSHQQSFNIR